MVMPIVFNNATMHRKMIALRFEAGFLPVSLPGSDVRTLSTFMFAFPPIELFAIPFDNCPYFTCWVDEPASSRWMNERMIYM
jgi:hypothetical protein